MERGKPKALVPPRSQWWHDSKTRRQRKATGTISTTQHAHMPGATAHSTNNARGAAAQQQRGSRDNPTASNAAGQHHRAGANQHGHAPQRTQGTAHTPPRHVRGNSQFMHTLKGGRRAGQDRGTATVLQHMRRDATRARGGVGRYSTRAQPITVSALHNKQAGEDGSRAVSTAP